MKAEGLLPEDTKRNAATTVAGIESMPAFARGNFARIACTSKMPPCLPPGIWSSLLDKVS